MITIEQITQKVGCSKRSIFRYMKATKIKGTRTKPALYPDEAVDVIQRHIGVPSLAQLRDLKRRASQARYRRAA